MMKTNDSLSPTPNETPSDLEPIIEMMAQLRPRMRQILSSYRVPYPDTEDLLQDVLLVAFRKWESIRTLDAWLIGTLRHKCWMYWKRRRYNLLQAVDFETLESLSEPQPPMQEKSDRLLDLESLCGSLCARHREVLWLRFGLGMTTVEVAKRTGYNQSSIRKLTCRTVARLQRQMGRPARGWIENCIE
jgi:RNA polymerase sigma factor (sigma-70 family)